MMARKNIIIDNEKWNTLKVITETKKNKSISKIISLAVDKLIEDEFNNNLAFKLKMIAMDKYVDEEEEMDIENDLKSMSKEELKIAGKLEI
jgi:hypothetical protein